MSCCNAMMIAIPIYSLRENVRLFISIGGFLKSSNVIPVDDYKQRCVCNVFSAVHLLLNPANENNVDAPRHNKRVTSIRMSRVPLRFYFLTDTNFFNILFT